MPKAIWISHKNKLMGLKCPNSLDGWGSGGNHKNLNPCLTHIPKWTSYCNWGKNIQLFKWFFEL